MPGLLRAREESEEAAEAAAPIPAGPVSLSTASLDELLALGMSMTQAKRVVIYREERGGFKSVDELDDVPGFPRTFLLQIKDQLAP
jgi:competence protein ComEA